MVFFTVVGVLSVGFFLWWVWSEHLWPRISKSFDIDPELDEKIKKRISGLQFWCVFLGIITAMQFFSCQADSERKEKLKDEIMALEAQNSEPEGRWFDSSPRYHFEPVLRHSGDEKTLC